MKQFRVVIIGLLAAFGLVGVTLGAGWIKEGTASILIPALAGIALLVYVWDTHRIAEVTEAQLLESQRPKVGIELVVRPSDLDFIINTDVTNMSNAFCQVWTKFDMQVYGKPVSHGSRYDGTEPWLLVPNSKTQGWFSISEILQKAGKNLSDVLADAQTPAQEKFSITVQLRAKGTPGGEIEYPPLSWYVRLDQAKVACVFMS